MPLVCCAGRSKIILVLSELWKRRLVYTSLLCTDVFARTSSLHDDQQSSLFHSFLPDVWSLCPARRSRRNNSVRPVTAVPKRQTKLEREGQVCRQETYGCEIHGGIEEKQILLYLWAISLTCQKL
ncbi:hypothetical protein AUEXF2481DRAFT_225331 [Aureobasidium subglaciale EXF-2481]|uniref:Uncharacterized protein n=1 Tax=Aureobasidium subglaciale (strain EXF-2481) TaxID=1043005 RepID=A0A074Z7P7_AURSE|nr:uncharacterized protein AUEXF2481DRAFT_225331 [Aureobasidium subglaciale EXF-2481]KEQ94906.1 hypothetical protein AUEXF2481DRAFT_225331 [Aureobasidium subglaciale EXF-2481]